MSGTKAMKQSSLEVPAEHRITLDDMKLITVVQR